MRHPVKGTILIATDPCYMGEGETEPALTVGKAYEVLEAHDADNIHNMPPHIEIENDKGAIHLFEMQGEDNWALWFTIKGRADGKEPNTRELKASAQLAGHTVNVYHVYEVQEANDCHEYDVLDDNDDTVIHTEHNIEGLTYDGTMAEAFAWIKANAVPVTVNVTLTVKPVRLAMLLNVEREEMGDVADGVEIYFQSQLDQHGGEAITIDTVELDVRGRPYINEQLAEDMREKRHYDEAKYYYTIKKSKGGKVWVLVLENESFGRTTTYKYASKDEAQRDADTLGNWLDKLYEGPAS